MSYPQTERLGVKPTSYLFLDFDGVLHPQYEGSATPPEVQFCHQQRFETVMRAFPEVKIVISSTWRLHFTLDQLRSRFSKEIAERIIDTTPQTDLDAYLPLRREQEILAWLAASGSEDSSWIALDDAVWQFERHRDKVVPCIWYVGLDDVAAEKLRNALIDCVARHRL